MAFYHSMLSQVHAVIGRSRVGARAAIAVRNQCQCIIAHHISQSDAFEENGEALLARTIAANASCFVDVGANHGLWSRTFVAAAPKTVRGLLFDPGEFAMGILRSHFADDPRIELIRAAVSDLPGESILFEEPGGGGSSSLVPEWSLDTAKPRPTPVTTLDIELEKRGVAFVDMLKIDVEGYDYRAMLGAAGLFSKQRIGVVQFEYNTPWIGAGGTLSAAISFLHQHSYKTFRLKGEGLVEPEYRKFGEHFARANYVGVSPASLEKVRSIIR